jgi:hypothetical protein
MKFKQFPLIFPIVLIAEITSRAISAPAYDGVFEMFGQVRDAIERQTTPPAPPPSVQILENDGPASAEVQAQTQAELQQQAPIGGISPHLADLIVANKAYRPGQTQAALRSALGAPTWQRGGNDLYYIAGTSDGVWAGKRLVIVYQNGIAIDWYQS